jgi:DNA-directed RNA polymerase subunit RPC12/RpoP
MAEYSHVAIPPTPVVPEPYYTKYGVAHDWILRCKDCHRLILHRTIVRVGACPRCGTRAFKEVRGLSAWEWLKIRLGVIDFPHRAEFLKEFGVVR